jgi:hypothetical protein
MRFLSTLKGFVALDSQNKQTEYSFQRISKIYCLYQNETLIKKFNDYSKLVTYLESVIK